MGEIFAAVRPPTPLEFTGERLTSAAYGQIEYEHLHRYCFARLFCRGKDVVDVAAGEGYGSALLAQVARSVVGVELAADAVEHAARAYGRGNLRFVRGDARRLPLRTGSVDVVVSFETIEHLYEQDLFLAEIRRVLRADGVLVISSPDSEIYSNTGSEVNAFHVRELTGTEFKDSLQVLFPHVQFYSQRPLIGSAISIEVDDQEMVTFERRSDDYIDASSGLPHAPYVVAVAGADGLPAPRQTLYIDQTNSAKLLASHLAESTEALPDGRVPVVEAERAALNALLAERDGRIETLSASLARAARQRDEAKLAAAEAVHGELSRLRAALAEAVRERDTARQEAAAAVAAADRRMQELRVLEADAARLRTLLADRDSRIAMLSADGAAAAPGPGQGLDEEVCRLEDEVARLRHALEEADWRVQEQERIAAQREAAALATLARQAAEHARAAAVLQTPLTGLGAERANTATRRPWRGASPMLSGRRRERRLDKAIQDGDRASRQRDWPAAAASYRRALDLAPELMPIWVQLGHALKEMGDTAGAEAAYRRALVLDDSVADTHLQLGHLLKLAARPDDAADAYARALQLDPDLRDAASELEHLAGALVEQGDRARDARNWVLAARYYRRALDQRSGLMPIWVQLGHTLKEQGDYVGAEAAYRRALVLDPSVADTHLQLGHLLKLQGRRIQAAEAYAAAFRLDPQSASAREALHAIHGYSPVEIERMMAGDGETALAARGRSAPLTLAECYGALFDDASRKVDAGYDIIWLGVIDWHFRIQRPQHLATSLADAGGRVFYVSLVFERARRKGRFRILDTPHPGVFEVKLRVACDPSESVYQGLSEVAIAELQLALDELVAALGVRAPIVVVEHPAWHEVACAVPGATVVYDCLDLFTGFSNAVASLAAAEAAMITRADLVVAASQPLAEHVAPRRSSVVIRNAAEVEFFAQAFTDRVAGERPVIGYFGAIADWFNIEWIEACAAARPQWEFHLIGRTDGCDTARAARLPNVRFYGELPYDELPSLLRAFDVAIIPFKMVELTQCTNPVKLYEYMAAGKPVVASPMPEVIAATDLVYIADHADSFAQRIAQALVEDTPALRKRRRDWARAHTWPNRAGQLIQAIDDCLPLVSVIVLSYNGWQYTNECLFSLRNLSDYPNIEIIIVDNASTDQTRDRLRALQRRDERLRIILNEDNLGFAGGNNVGLRAARGEYVILLNNDTYVTRGWVRDLIRPMQLDPRIGMVGPLTNNIGNEQKVKAVYGSMREMQEWARRFSRARLRRTFEVENLAFFCVALRRSMVEAVGLLDEAYGVGFFEDDDYCRRAKQANWRMVIADDVFVHHHLSVSFDTLGAKAAELMAKNRAIFEGRWGPWRPHRYRDEPGFG